MNKRLVCTLVGTMLKYEACFMVAPLAVSLLYGDSDWLAFLIAMALSGLAGFLLCMLKPDDSKFRSRDGFAAVALAWLACSLFGALPYYFSGSFHSFIDCAFESISGFSTTGATIITDIEKLPKGILFWRSFTQWIGGVGVVVLSMAVMPAINPSTVNLLRVEFAGQAATKIVPRIKQSARILYLIYFSMTLIVVALLKIAGLSLYDSLVHAFSVAGTGGFSNMNQSVGAFNNLSAEIIIAVFVFLFGINLSLYYYLFKKNFHMVFKDEELLCFAGIVIVSIIIITIDTTKIYGNAFTALRHASFQVPSIITSAGFTTTDYNAWPTLSRLILILVMLIGGSAGSTCCGFKVVRVIIVCKALKVELSKINHPQMFGTVKFNGKNIDHEVVNKVFMYFFVYLSLIGVGILFISFENYDPLTTISAVVSAVSNIGPGLAEVGPTGTFAFFSPFSKIVLSFCMLAGRLEIYPVLVLFSPSLWKKSTMR